MKEGKASAQIVQSEWDKIYKKEMNPVRDYLKANMVSLLNSLNYELFSELWNKYCSGTISKWEIDSISFYHHEHELEHIDEEYYKISNFFELPEDPEVDKVVPINGRKVPLFKLVRIAGTVLDKDKSKSTVSLLTKHGVVNVKLYKTQFAKYDRQLSMKMPNGKKKVVEGSWFKRGNKLLFTGIRRGDDFVPKVYKNSIYKNTISLITSIDGSKIEMSADRAEVE